MIEALAGVEVCVTQMAPLTERVLDACPDLRLFCVGRGGPVNANLDAARRAGVAVTFAPGRNATATAEHTLALMLAAARRIPAVHADLVAGTWRGDYYVYDQVGPEVAGSTVGLVGYGAIGRRVADMRHRLRRPGPRPRPLRDPADPAVRAEVGRPRRPAVQRATSSPCTPGSRPRPPGLIGAGRGSPRCPPARSWSTARAARCVDYDAVCDALDDGPAVRCRVRRVPRRADPGRVPAADHARPRPHPAPGRRQPPDRAQRRADRRRRGRPLRRRPGARAPGLTAHAGSAVRE